MKKKIRNDIEQPKKLTKKELNKLNKMWPNISEICEVKMEESKREKITINDINQDETLVFINLAKLNEIQEENETMKYRIQNYLYWLEKEVHNRDSSLFNHVILLNESYKRLTKDNKEPIKIVE